MLPKVGGKKLEDAYWSSRELMGYKITPVDVIIGYLNDSSSLRTAFFLQKLCLRRICYGNWSVSPEEVIAAFRRNKGQKNKCDLAVARFKSECCLTGLPLHGEPITADSVVEELKQLNATLELARFQNACCRKGIVIFGQPIPAETVLENYQAIDAKLEQARFLQECCLTGLALHGQHVTADEVISQFPATRLGRLGAARFRGECFLHGLPLNGEQISAETVACNYQMIVATLELAHFMETCCLHNVTLNGQAVTPRQVLQSYQTTKAELDQALFKQQCYLNNLSIAGVSLTPESVVGGFPNTQRGRLGIACFKAQCFLRHLQLNGQLLAPESVAREFRTIGAALELLRFKAQCCLKAIPVSGQQLLPEALTAAFESIAATMELARFKAQCCLTGLWLYGHPIAPAEVINEFPPSQKGKLEAALFKAQCCLKGLLVGELTISPEAVLADFQALAARLEEANFKAQCCLAHRCIEGQAVTPQAVLDTFPPSPTGQRAAACFTMACCLQGLAPASPSTVVDTLADTKALTELAYFKEQCCLTGLHMAERMINPEEVISEYQAANVPLEAMRFQAQCCLKGLFIHGQQISLESMVSNIPKTQPGAQQLARIKAQCCLQGINIFGRPVTPREVIKDFQIAHTPLEWAQFQEACCLRGLDEVSPETVANNYQAINAPRELGQFKQQCCLLGLLLYGKPVAPETVLEQYERDGWLLEQAMFTAQLALKGRKVNGKHLSNSEVLEAFQRVPGNCVTQQLDYLIQRLHAVPRLDYSDEAQAIFTKAWQLINDLPVKNNQSRVHKCRLRYLALRYAFWVDDQLMSADQVMQPVKALGNSFLKTRLRGAILAHCHRTQQTLHGQKVTRAQVLECLHKLPVGAMRETLTQWLKELCTPSSTHKPDHGNDPQSSLITGGKFQPKYRRPQVIPLSGNHERVKRVSVLVSDLYAGGDLFSCLVEYPDDGAPDVPSYSDHLTQLTRTALKLIQGNDQLCITGECSHYLQGTGKMFDYIDIIGCEAAIERLIATATAQLSRANPAVPTNVFALAVPAIPQLHQPTTIHITLVQGELGSQTTVLRAHVHPVAKVTSLARVLVTTPKVDQPLQCLSLAAEAMLMNTTLSHLIDSLDRLTTQLEESVAYPSIVPTILFKDFARQEDRVCSLLVHCLLTLNKAQQLASIEGPQQAELIRLSEILLTRLQNHSYRKQLVTGLTQWLKTAQHNSHYQADRYEIMQNLLATLNKSTAAPLSDHSFESTYNRMESYCNHPV